MTFEEFAKATKKMPDTHTAYGPYVWEQLEKVRPDLAAKAKGTKADASEWTMNLQYLWPWLKENWET